MDRIIKILMERDHLSENEAINFTEEVKAAIDDCIADGCYDEAEDIVRYELGLEPDYLEDLLD